MRHYRGWYLLPFIPVLLVVAITVLWRGFQPPPEPIAIAAPAAAPAPTPVKVNCSLCEQFAPIVGKLMPKLDRTGKGYVTRIDVDQAILTDHTIKGEEASALYALRENFAALAIRGANGELQVGIAQLQAFHDILPASTAAAVEASMTAATDFLKIVHRGLYPAGTPEVSLHKMRALNQRNRGNCYLLSGIGSLSVIDVDQVRSMITDNGLDARGIRTFSVRFIRAPGEEYLVEELTDAAVLINDVDMDSGIWSSVLVRAYGMYQMRHPYVRIIQRWFFNLNERILPEDLTNEGSMSNDGLRMMSPPGAKISRIVWKFDKTTLQSEIGDALVQGMQQLRHSTPEQLKAAADAAPWLHDCLELLPLMDDQLIEALVNFYLKEVVAEKFADWADWALTLALYSERNPARTHALLKKSICDQRLPATVTKYGGTHEASIIAYHCGTVSSDGKHTSAYGFVTIRDQAGLSAAERDKVTAGIWWRDPGADFETVTMTVEEFTAFYTGVSSAVR